MSLEFVSILFETPGTLMIAYAALSVHHRFLHEHAIDEAVFATMKREQRVGKIGVVLVLIGFGLQVASHLI